MTLSDIEIVSALQGAVLGSPLAAALAIFAARYLIAVFFVFAAFLYVSKRRHERHAAAEAAWAVMFALLITNAIGFFVGRDRPFQRLGSEVILLIPEPLTSAFPSGHTAASFALAAAIYWGNKRLGIAAFAVAFAIAAGRIMVGVHYPSDVAAGAAVGLAGFGLIRYIHKAIGLKKV